MKLWSARSLISFLFLGVSVARAQEPTEVSKTWDIVYANAGDSELRLDLVQPAAAKVPGPAVLVIHGGAWREGAKEENRKILVDFARRGYVAIPSIASARRIAFPRRWSTSRRRCGGSGRTPHP